MGFQMLKSLWYLAGDSVSISMRLHTPNNDLELSRPYEHFHTTFNVLCEARMKCFHIYWIYDEIQYIKRCELKNVIVSNIILFII